MTEGQARELHQAAVDARKAAESTEAKASKALQSMFIREKGLSAELAAARSALVAKIIEAPDKTPDAGRVLKIRTDEDLLRSAISELSATVPLLGIATLEAQAAEKEAEAALQQAIARGEEQAAVAALATVGPTLGPGTEIQLDGALFQRRRAHADSLILEAARLRRQAEERHRILYPAGNGGR